MIKDWLWGAYGDRKVNPLPSSMATHLVELSKTSMILTMPPVDLSMYSVKISPNIFTIHNDFDTNLSVSNNDMEALLIYVGRLISMFYSRAPGVERVALKPLMRGS